jgi:hypothetical protein
MWAVRRRPKHKIAKSTPCKVEWAPAAPRCRRHPRRKYRWFAAAWLQEQHRRALAKAGSERVEGRTLCEGIWLIRRNNCKIAP